MRAADSERGESRTVVEGARRWPDRHGSDRSLPLPAGDEAPEEGRWDKAWGGIASLGLALPVLWTGMTRRGLGRGAHWRVDGHGSCAARGTGGPQGSAYRGLRRGRCGLRSGCGVERGPRSICIFATSSRPTSVRSCKDACWRHGCAGIGYSSGTSLSASRAAESWCAHERSR